jgi:hypothetical protein
MYFGRTVAKESGVGKVERPTLLGSNSKADPGESVLQCFAALREFGVPREHHGPIRQAPGIYITESSDAQRFSYNIVKRVLVYVSVNGDIDCARIEDLLSSLRSAFRINLKIYLVNYH